MCYTSLMRRGLTVCDVNKGVRWLVVTSKFKVTKNLEKGEKMTKAKNIRRLVKLLRDEVNTYLPKDAYATYGLKESVLDQAMVNYTLTSFQLDALASLVEVLEEIKEELSDIKSTL